jgi:hypothetical protein
MSASTPPRSQVPASGSKSLADSKPGSEPTKLNLPHDFGARADDAVERQYASQAALNQDPGRLQSRSNDETGGMRQAGAGTTGHGPGAGSGGDIDPDIIGVGTGGRTIAASFPDQRERDADGPDRTGGSAGVFASGKPANRENQDRRNLTANDNVPRGGTVTYERDSQPGALDTGGADSIRTTDAEDPFESAAGGEISRGESVGPADSSSSSAER